MFRQMARRVRFQRALRSVLSGTALGAAASTALAFSAFYGGFAGLRGYAAAALGLGLLAGALSARRRRWSDTDVALFLDARLGAAESFTTGVLAAEKAPLAADAARARALESAAAARPEQLRSRALLRWHALLPLSVAGFAWIALEPAPPKPATARPSIEVERVERKDVPGLDRIEKLDRSAALSAADAERLAALSREAKKLSAELERGVERREAQARIGQLRDEIAGARQRFGSGNERAGLEAALRAMRADRSMRPAERALAEGDLVEFDDEMRKLANQAEGDARRAARETLDEAARAARERGAKNLAEMLERQKRDFAQREGLNRALGELAEGLGEKLGSQARRDLEQALREGDAPAAERLSEALARAFAGLNEEERRRLLESLKRELESDPALAPMDRESLRKLVEQLGTPQGERALLEALRQAARGRDATRERSLDDAERGAAEAEHALRGLPLPMPGTGNSGPGEQAKGSGEASPGRGQDGAQAGPGRGAGVGSHDGHTAPIDGPELRAKAEARVLPGVPLGARGFGRAPGERGATATQVGPGEMGAARADAIDAVEGSDVPEDYREHVGRYFEP